MNQNKVTAIIVAAGSGKRMGQDLSKQFITLNDKPILVYTLEKFQNSQLINEIVLVLSEDYMDYYQKHIYEKYQFTKVKLAKGGKERYDSVYNGLLSSSLESNVILIHDGVRPFVSSRIIDEVIENTYTFGACIPVIHLKDTIKKVNNNFVIETVNRNEFFAAQTPQGFMRKLILRAYEEFDKSLEVTDDSSLVEFLGEKVKTISGEYKNIKITTPEDLLFANSILEYDL